MESMMTPQEQSSAIASSSSQDDNGRTPPQSQPIHPTNNHDDPSSLQDEASHRILPPSHILPDGRYIHLPPPTELESSAYFERAVASHRLISNNDSAHHLSNNKKKRKAKNDNDKPYIHPLAVASARLRSKGIDELSKAINLGGLVGGNEYFGLTNVVVTDNNNRHAAAVHKKKKESEDNNDDDETTDQDPNNNADQTEEALLNDNDKRLRSSYALNKYRSQYNHASSVLMKRSKRLLYSLSGRRVLDSRLRSLRQRWRLAAPERRPGGMVRARDVVCVDVDVYHDKLGNGAGDNNGERMTTEAAAGGHSLGKIARRVPRFATIELEDGYDVSKDVTLLRDRVDTVWEELLTPNVELESVTDKPPSAMEVDNDNDDIDDTNNNTPQQCKTKAEPYAIADPTLGPIDPDFDPDKVPLLTLLFEIEKPSTGFVQRATLSSSIHNNTNNNNNNNSLSPDERVIESLQHSLFCASLFESMRAEIIPPPKHSTTTHTQERNESVAWLSSEMEESFLPPPSHMAGGGGGSRNDNNNSIHAMMTKRGESRLLCVVHCREGEVKVQLNDEYCFTAKLIEVGTTVAAARDDDSNNNNNEVSTTNQNDGGALNESSGTESAARLQTLCKALLLHAQYLYHEHRTIKQTNNNRKNHALDTAKPKGLARVKKEEKLQSPQILQSCVGLGCKYIFERKVRSVLKRISNWLEKEKNCQSEMKCQWLPLGMFDTHSQFVLLFRDLCLDVGIDGDALCVTQVGSSGEYRSVCLSSEIEFEMFLRLEFDRRIANTLN